MAFLLKAVLGLSAVYLVLVAALFFAQRSLIFPAPPGGAGAIPAGYDRISYITSDGLLLKAGYKPASQGCPTILYFHGNGADWQSSTIASRQLAASGYGVLAAEYRGYRGNPGTPSEAGIYRDARAAATWLFANGVPAEHIVLIGNSIGSGAATQLATELAPKALILISPFSSLEAAVGEKVRWAPAGWLLKDEFDNLAKLPEVKAPVLILHGDADDLIGDWHSRALANARPSAKLVIVPGAGHDLAWSGVAGAELSRFLSTMHR
ncbi:alpha/beta hydrolase [Altererythrobacter aquiaggeris]|uniref:alpha/beta hydrolase n=1 Tax=Aestuarierythrobacter aquiaggeris TaxID=1898396 RepID=UPI0030165C59